MSIQITTKTWKTSTHTGTALLMMLALSDFANANEEAWPAVSTLARMCRVTTRHGNRLLAALQASGEIEVKLRQGPRGCNLYRVLPGRGSAADPGSSDEPGPPSAPVGRAKHALNTEPLSAGASQAEKDLDEMLLKSFGKSDSEGHV